MVQSTKHVHGGGGALDAINHIYEQFPAFTDVFDEETFYLFAFAFTCTTVLLAVIASRFITIKPSE
jgi:large subunit ribosomal protein L53